MIISTRAPQAAMPAGARSAATQTPANSAEARDRAELGTQYPRPLTYVPTAAGTLAMVGIAGSSTAAGACLAASLAPAAAVQGGAAGLLVGMVLAGVAGHFMDRQAEEHYAQTGEGTAWMKPAFTSEEITGLPAGSGVRGLF